MAEIRPGAQTYNIALADLCEGDSFVSGVHAQALVSRAIKLGQTLRFQPRLAKLATVAQLAMLVFTVAWIVTDDTTPITDVVIGVIGFLVSILAVWVVATVGRQRDAYWANISHAGVVTRRGAYDGGRLWLCESLAHGVRFSPLDKYEPSNIRFIPSSRGMNVYDRVRSRAFAYSVVDEKTGYGFVVFASLFVYCLTAGLTFLPTLVLFQSGTAICSAFACDFLTGPYRWRHEVVFQMPANLWADLSDRLGLVW